jgi:hypothetical protein
MAKVVIGAQVQVEGLDQANKSVGSFKKQLREATNELVNMSEKFGLASTEAQNAAKKVAMLRDGIGDAKALADTFNPDKKFVALGGAIQGVTAGFSAYSGAMGILGGKSEDVEKILLKVQSAMALQQGISGIAGAIDSFKMLANTVKGSVVKAFSTLRGALIATGIGAAVVAVGLLVANFDKVKQVVLNFIPGLSKVIDFFGNLVNSITDFIGVTSEAERATKKLMEATEKSIKSNSEWLDANGTKYDEYTQRRLKAVFDYQQKVAEIAKDEEKTEEEKTTLILAYKDKLARETSTINADKVKDEKDAQDKLDAIAKKVAEEERKRAEEKKKGLDALKEYRRKTLADEIKQIEEFGDELKKADDAASQSKIDNDKKNKEYELEARLQLAEQMALNDPDNPEFKKAKIAANLEIELAGLEDGSVAQQNARLRAQQAFSQIDKDGSEARRKIAEAEVAAKMETMAAIGGALESLSEVVGKETAAGKAMAVAAAVINVAQGVTKAIGQGGVAGIATGVVVAAAGLISIKKILSTKIPGKNSGDGSSANIGSLAPRIAPNPTRTSLDANSINAIGSAAGHAFVLETDVTNNQERIRRLNRAARINTIVIIIIASTILKCVTSCMFIFS